MNMQQLRRHHVGRALHRVAAAKAQQEYSELMHAQAAMDDDWDWDDDYVRSATCPVCLGSGGDPWNDGVTPCEYCDGEGYEWWN